MKLDAMWIMHAYDYFVCGYDVIITFPNHHIIRAMMIFTNRWRTHFTVFGISPVDNLPYTHTFDEYHYVYVDRTRHIRE